MKNILFTQRVRKYRGKYIAVAGGRVIVSGKDAKEAFNLAKKVLGSRKVEGVYYIPQRRDLLTALCVFPIADQEFVADIGFSEQLGVAFNLLGRKSFFDRFRVCFNDRHRFIDITLLP